MEISFAGAKDSLAWCRGFIKERKMKKVDSLKVRKSKTHTKLLFIVLLFYAYYKLAIYFFKQRSASAKSNINIDTLEKKA